MKILVSDYDRTFYRNEEEIHLNVDSINNFMKNNIFIIATGRSEFDIKRAITKYNINYNYLILNHGATIIKNDKVIYNIPIDNDVKNGVLDVLKYYNFIGMFVCTKENSRASIDDDNLTKIHITFTDERLTNFVKKEIENKYGNFVNVYFASQGKSLEIVSKKVGKAIALNYLINFEKFDVKDIFTVGDDVSDKLMLQEYNGYAINNAVDEIKSITQNSCTSVHELVKKLSQR